MNRRALLAAGGAALLTGCGAPKRHVVSAATVLDEQRQATQALAAAFAGLPAAERARVQRLASRAAARVQRVGGARPGAAPATTLEDVLHAEQTALRAHVAGVGLTTDQELRVLLAGLVADTAQDSAALLRELGRQPLVTAFPGQPG